MSYRIGQACPGGQEAGRTAQSMSSGKSMMHVRNMQSSHKHTYPSPEVTIVFKRVKQAEKGSGGEGGVSFAA